MIDTEQVRYDRQIAYWLILCAVVIYGMILLGGVTRLTGSGLSMVEWRPLVGIIPPLSEQAWLDVFEKYKQFPEYQKTNAGMSLADFKYIFMYEYLHRVLGRVIGMLFFFPFLFFYFKGRIKSGLTPKLLVMFTMGGLQGLLGWYMVKSGLVDNPRVSQYRLTSHLGVAVLIYAYMLWVAFDLFSPRLSNTESRRASQVRWSVGLIGLIYLMILSGGLVAGTRAGYAYSTWPLMGPTFIPQGLYSGASMWVDAFEDITTIQFNHRMFAYLLFALISTFSYLVFRSTKDITLRVAAVGFFLALLLQVIMGISTLLLHVPVSIAAAHQVGAVLLLTSALYLSHVLLQQHSKGRLS